MKHIDAATHTRGESQYIDDVPQPEGMLHAAVFGSPIAHGRLLTIDLDKAREVPGVRTILTADDIPGENQVGALIADEMLLAESTVHFVGEPIALVLAETPATAHKAAQMISVETEALPVITDPRVAFEKGEIIGATRTFVLGDVDQAWKDCDVVVEGSCEIAGQEHLYLETQRARAVPREDGCLQIYASTQSPYAVQKGVARILGLPHHKVEVDVKRLGGGFGGKEDQATHWACLAALGAQITGKAIELVLPRHQDMVMTGKRHPYSSDYKIGLKQDGKIVAYEARHYQNAGAAADLSPAILERTLFHSTNAYFIPNVRAFAASCRTNLPPNTAFRGFGGPQGMFVIESAITKAAETLEVTREEIQLKNLLQDHDIFPYGQQVHDANIRRTWQEAEKSFKLKNLQKRIREFNDNHFEKKKGFAIMPICFGISFTATFLNQAGALVHVYTDGSVSVSTGGVEMGQGLITNLAKIAATAFGIDEARVKVETTNTTRVANMSPSAASATTDLNGNATLAAASEILQRLKSFAVKELNLSHPERLTIEKETLLFEGKETGWTWQKLVQSAYFNRVDLSAHGFYATPGVWFNKDKEKGHPFAYHVFGTAAFEVTVDCLRGTYEIDKTKIVHDLGRPMNELIDRGQIEGGLAQGLGWMTLEELKFDDQGRYLSNSLASYKVPDVFFMPDDLEIKLLENVNNTWGPYGTKAVGEPPLMYGIGVFFALQDAMRAFRPEMPLTFDTPMTPEKVLMQLHRDEIEGFKTDSDVMADHQEQPVKETE